MTQTATTYTLPRPTAYAVVTPYLSWEGDFLIDDQGRTIVIDADTAYIQRLIRRLLTSPRYVDAATQRAIAAPDYIFAPAFGAGLRRMVGRPFSLDDIYRIVLEQIFLDPETSNNYRPQINATLDSAQGVVMLQIKVQRTTSATIAFGIRFSAQGAG